MSDVSIRFSSDLEEQTPAELDALVGQAIRETLTREGVNFPCEAEVLYTDPAGIRHINAEFRGKPEVTDVLSFPYFSFLTGERPAPEPDTGRVMLGEIALCLERCEEQAREYGHTREREITFLSVHAALHLLGYDHEADEETKRMRSREKEIIQFFQESSAVRGEMEILGPIP